MDRSPLARFLPARNHKLFFRRIFLIVALLFVSSLSVAEDQDTKAQVIGVWNVTELKQVPSMRWLDQTTAVHSLLYAGEAYQGQPTEVFAFYASPQTVGDSTDKGPYPGVVLIHGGGGTAFAEWAWLWASRGYAAIAMDLSGHRPPPPQFDSSTGKPIPNQAAQRSTRTRLANGGPDQGPAEKFDSIRGDRSQQWPWHAAANAVRAHSLLRSFPEVDAQRTAVTGISWGGYTTCLAASLDSRFKAAVPVYGCGFLYEGESVQKPAIDKLGDAAEQWIATYDPSSLLPHCSVPLLFVNGTNDVHYPLDSYQKSFDVAGSAAKQLRIEVNMRHSHPAGWAPQEIGLFIDSWCRTGKPLPVPAEPVVSADGITVNFESEVALKSAALHFTSDSGRRSDRKWQTVPAKLEIGKITAPPLPPDANTWFVSLTDQRDAMVTTTIQFQK